MTDKVETLVKVETKESPVRELLLEALREDFSHVVVVAVNEEGDLWVRSSGGINKVNAIGQLEVAKMVVFESLGRG